MTRPSRKGGIVTIANGGTTSTSVDLNEGKLVGINVPAAFTTADLSVEVSQDDGLTFKGLLAQDGTTVVKVTGAVAGKQYGFNKDMRTQLLGARTVRLVASVAQGAQRLITLIVE
jgi:hypothetical protein